MGKTLKVAADRASDQTKTVLPAEYARGVYMTNPPSLSALKLFHLMIGTAGGRMADEVQHEMRLSDIRKIDGMKNHDRASLTPLFVELSTTVLVHDDTEAKRVTVGGLVDEARIDYRNEASGDLLVTWWFGRLFRRLAEASNHWAILDRQTVFHLGSRYSVLLFQHIASLVGLNSVRSKTFTIPELRAVLGIPTGKIKRFADLNSDVLQPVISEINQLSRLTLTATANKIGRTVASITISWEVKANPSAAKRELSVSKVGRKARRQAVEEPPQAVRWRERPVLSEGFPIEGPISFGPWAEIAREHLPHPQQDVNRVAENFRLWVASRRGMTLATKGIEKAFVTFCKGADPVK